MLKIYLNTHRFSANRWIVFENKELADKAKMAAEKQIHGIRVEEKEAGSRRVENLWLDLKDIG